MTHQSDHDYFERMLASMTLQQRQGVLGRLFHQAVLEYQQTGVFFIPQRMMLYNRYLLEHPNQPVHHGEFSFTYDKKWAAFSSKQADLLRVSNMTPQEFFSTIFREVRWLDWDRMEIDEEEPRGPKNESRS